MARRAHVPSRQAMPVPAGRRGDPRAFTLVELLVVILIIGIVAALLIPLARSTQGAAKSVQCQSKLLQIGSAFLQYAMSNNGRLPQPRAAQVPWEQVVAPMVGGTEAFRCPADDELAGTLGSSYDWRDTGVPETTLAGRLLQDVNRRGVVLAFEVLPGWHERNMVNAVNVDGAVKAMSQDECFGDLMKPVRAQP